MTNYMSRETAYATPWLKKIMLSVVGALLLVTPTLAQDAPAQVCIASVSQFENVAKLHEISPEEKAAIIAKKGKAPAEGDFATLESDEMGMLVIHDGDCIKWASGKPVPLPVLNKFLGRVDA